MFNQLFRVADPYHDLHGHSLHGLRQVEALLGELARPRRRSTSPASLTSLTNPTVDLLDEGDGYRLALDVPGLRPEDLHIDATEDGITIRGERTVEAPEGYTVHRRERQPLQLARSLSFPTKIDPDAVDATLAHGVLTITLTKRAELRPRSIPVRTAA